MNPLLRKIGYLLTLIYMLLVALIVLWPVHVDDNAAGGLLHDLLTRGHTEGWLPLWFNYGLVEWLSNLVMFVPGGLLLGLLLARPLRTWVPLAGLCTSLGIETIQHLMPGRTSSALDVLANFLGALLGWGLAGGLRILRKKQQGR